MACPSPMASILPRSLPIMAPPPNAPESRRAGNQAALPRRSWPDFLGLRRPRQGARAVVAMADGDGQRVGLVGAFEPGLRQQEADHGRDLALFRVTGTHDALLDEVGGILGDLEPAHSRSQQRHAARLTEL